MVCPPQKVTPSRRITAIITGREFHNAYFHTESVQFTKQALTRLITRTCIVGLWRWGSYMIGKRKKSAHREPFSFRVVTVAGFGLLTASLLT